MSQNIEPTPWPQVFTVALIAAAFIFFASAKSLLIPFYTLTSGLV